MKHCIVQLGLMSYVNFNTIKKNNVFNFYNKIMSSNKMKIY